LNTNKVTSWRRSIRAELLERRHELPEAERLEAQTAINQRIADEFPEIREQLLGFYWPIRGEIDLRPVVRDLIQAGAGASLPVITARNEPLEFARWEPWTDMTPGVWNIPVPSQPEWVVPTALLIPLLGFDSSGYRMGYGGGYYDRTLAALSRRPLTIGVGYALGQLDTIRPEPHDVALDAIVTESGVIRIATRC
jgi:5-formyltetrahydrofolate cyclo-ligase